jgi:hypothetical protein
MFFEQIGSGKKEFKLEMKLPNIKQHYYPYMDTFKFIDLEKGILYNYIPEDTSSLKTLTSSDGSKHPSDYLVFDEIDRVMRYRNDAAYVTYLSILTKDARYENLLDDYIFNEENNDKNSERVLKLIEQRQKEEEARQEAYKKVKDKKDTKSLIEELDGVAATMRGGGDLGNVYGGMPNGDLRQLFERAGRPYRARPVPTRDDRVEEVPGFQAEGRVERVAYAVDTDGNIPVDTIAPTPEAPTPEAPEAPTPEAPTPEAPEAPTIGGAQGRTRVRGNYYTSYSDWYDTTADWSAMDWDVTSENNEEPF